MNIKSSRNQLFITPKPNVEPKTQEQPKDPLQSDYWKAMDRFEAGEPYRLGAFITGTAVVGGFLGQAARSIDGPFGHIAGAVIGAGTGALVCGAGLGALAGSGNSELSGWAGLAGMLYGGVGGAVLGAVGGGVAGSAGMGIASTVGGALSGGLAGAGLNLVYRNYAEGQIIKQYPND